MCDGFKHSQTHKHGGIVHRGREVSVLTFTFWSREFPGETPRHQGGRNRLTPEAVRRAEWALGRAIRKGQAEGEIAKHGQTSSNLKSALDFGSRGEMYGAKGSDGILALADSADPETFESALRASPRGLTTGGRSLTPASDNRVITSRGSSDLLHL